ncbi:MAG: ABC transporter permease subunit [Bifidobacteriaceae bacterium]|jgi:NitT/TauT family transport system permease protein|nr:ABC transporter permease subunit [Bifidobacteriaceae bacterium]
MTRVARGAYGLLGIAALLGAMDVAVRSGALSHHAVPTAVEMVKAFGGLAVSGAFLRAVGQTLIATLLAFAAAAVVATPLGVLLGASRRAERLSSGLIETLRPIPSIALMPVAILALGIAIELKIALAGFASLWPLLINAIAGVRSADSLMIRTARSFTWSRARIMRRVQLRAALPFIVSGARQSISVALVIVVTLELLGAKGGIGEVIRQYSASGRVDYVFGGVLATGLLGLALHAVLSRGEARLLRWAPQHRAVRP